MLERLLSARPFRERVYVVDERDSRIAPRLLARQRHRQPAAQCAAGSLQPHHRPRGSRRVRRRPQLLPGQNGASSHWNSYIYSTVNPTACPAGVTACATAPTTQATVESATSGTFIDHGDGTY